MKLKIVFFSLLLLCSSSLFAKVTTDIKLGGLYGYNNTTYTDYDIKNNHNLIGFGAGCDVEFNKHFGLFFNLDCLFPLEKQEDTFDLFGLITVPDLKFYTHSVEGVEFVQYFNDNVKMRIGGLLAVEQKYYKAGSEALIETLVGPGLKFDTTFLFNKHFGINVGVDSSLFFWGFYFYSDHHDNSGMLDDFIEFNIIPSLSLVWHIGGSH